MASSLQERGLDGSNGRKKTTGCVRDKTRQNIYYLNNIAYNFLTHGWPKIMLVVVCKIYAITNRYHLIIYYVKGKEERKERIFTIMSRARKTNLFTASCEEAKV